jgi:hypothetical protein
MFCRIKKFIFEYKSINMRFVYTIMFISLFLITVSAQKIVPGYIILSNGDTLIGKIHFGGFKQTTNSQEVSFINNEGIEKQYNANNDEVKAFGFENIGVRKHYVYFKLKYKADSRWFERIYIGTKYSLYLTSVTGSFGIVDVTAPWFVLQKPTGEYVFLENCGLCGWRQKLTEFLIDNPDAQAQVETIKAKELGNFLLKISK